ncbi:hypothetical protein [Sinorhizobium arboris]|uniref:hypothetical protein n=1 Tax=Sinorhizobium arboris TaxID=76745 RepID=UPI00130D71A0|nr:hypothetical protein [Sinorhizobium arboris]
MRPFFRGEINISKIAENRKSAVAGMSLPPDPFWYLLDAGGLPYNSAVRQQGEENP